MENLELYNKVRFVPADAKKEILGGKLKGKTDINPMWRIKTLTEQFGICGFGWKTEIVDKWVNERTNGEIIANVKINLYIKVGNEWSAPIEGIGGSMLVALEKGQPVSNDEAFKMAYTDAISVACKMLGMGADVYWDKDSTKYSNALINGNEAEVQVNPNTENKCSICGNSVKYAWYKQCVERYGQAYCSADCRDIGEMNKKEKENNNE